MASAVTPVKAAAESIASAERHRWAAARRSGIRKGFSATAAPEATIFIPDPFDVAEWLEQNKYWNPSISGTWRPDTIILSCDGRTALTTGSWRNEEDHGYYATLWIRTGRSWRWSFHFDDRVDDAAVAARKPLEVHRASCRKANPNRLPPHVSDVDMDERHSSTDDTIVWAWWNVVSRYQLAVYEWNGRGYSTIIRKAIAHDYE